jgi:ABC-type multidrug transport system fused ATPase/permease subunit
LDLERSFLSRLVQEGAVDKAISFNITPDHFADPEVADVYGYVVAHFRIHRDPPSKTVIRSKYPNFTFDPAEDALSWYMEEFIKDVKRRAAIDAQRRVAIAIQDRSQLADIEVIMIEAARMVSTLVPSSKITRFSEMESRIAEYERKAAAGENPGIMTGFKTINNLTYGIQPYENWVILGPSGMGKSTLMQDMIFDFWIQEKQSLVVSMEMGAEQLMRNWDGEVAQDCQKGRGCQGFLRHHCSR